jgi:hypothetical protein
MRDHDPLCFSLYEQIADDLRTMSEIIRAARDEPVLRKTPELLITRARGEEARVHAKNAKA